MSNLAARLFQPRSSPHSRQNARPSSSALSETLEAMPGQKNNSFSDLVAREALGAMYSALFGSEKEQFPGSNTVLRHAQAYPDAKHQFLTEIQESILPKEPGERRAVACGRIFKKGECCFRCKDCAQDDSCVLCSTCFNATATLHATHNVSFFIAQQSGGCCDCGDAEAWRTDINCPHHAMRDFPFDWAEDTLHPSVSHVSAQYLTSATKSRMSAVFGTLLDFMLCTLDDSTTEPNAPANIPDLYSQPSGLPESGDMFSLVLWNDDKHSFEEVIGILCDLGRDPGVASSSNQFSFAIPDTTAPPTLASSVTIIPGSAVLLRTRAEATRLTHTIDQVGRATVAMSTPPPSRRIMAPDNSHTTGGLAKGNLPTPEDLLNIAHRVSQIDLGVTLRRSYDVFREDLVGVIVDFLVDMCSAAVSLPNLHGEGEDAGTNASHSQRVLRELLADEIFAPRIGGKGVPGANRIDLLFIYHTKLWKKARLGMKEVYASIGTLGPRWKARVASHFAYSYPHVLSSYLLVDREAETSIKYFALQVFTVPSIAHLVVQKHHLITRLLGVIVAFFGGKSSTGEDGRITIFDTSRADGGPTFAGVDTARHVLEPDSQPFKSKRFMPIFSDLRYLAHNEPVKRMIANHPTSEIMIKEFSKTCQLFTGVNPNRRMRKEHIEFESDSWISVFNVSLSLARVVRVYGDSWSIPANCGNVKELARAIEIVTSDILELNEKSGGISSGKLDPMVFHWVTFGGQAGTPQSWKVLKFEVGGETGRGVSFHHSLHWLLSELFKHVDLLKTEVLHRALGEEFRLGWRSLMSSFASDDALMTVVDIPLRVLAKVGQIRVGLWVRNGFAIKGQLIHYRDFMLRELCYDQDLFLFQSSFCFLPTAPLLVSLVDRFGLLNFFGGGDTPGFETRAHEAYEKIHLFGMAEEMLYVLMTVVSEPSSAGRWDIERQIRREVIHALVFGPSPYTELVKRVAERLVDDASFERVLKQVANFRAPEGTHDTGFYDLKKECFDEVSPWYFHYTRNRREEAEGILAERAMKQQGLAGPGTKAQEVLHLPKPWTQGVGENSPFRDVIPAILEQHLFLQIVFYSIWRAGSSSAASVSAGGEDAVMDNALHLIIIALTDRPLPFAKMAAETSFNPAAFRGSFHEPKTLLDLLCAMEDQEIWKACKLRVDWILSQIATVAPEAVAARRSIPDSGSAEVLMSEEEKKRAAAKKRKEAILAKMKRQQDAMVNQIDHEAVMEDEDGDEIMGDATQPQDDTSHGTCIVCQEDLTSAKAFGTLGMIQPSRFIRRHPDGQHQHLTDVLNSPASFDRAAPADDMPHIFPPTPEKLQESRARITPNFDGFPAQHTRFGLVGSVCSHMMHLECFTIYSFSVRQRHRSQATRNHPENIPRKEFICPLCKSLGNMILPVLRVTPTVPILNTTPFPDWIRAASIGILRSSPDPLLESLQVRTGTGEFAFWSAQDSAYGPLVKAATDSGHSTQDPLKMVDTIMVVAKSLSQQTRHLRDRPEPDAGERGAGLYLPEELVGYTIATLDIALRGVEAPAGGVLVDNLTEAQTRLVYGLVASLTKLVGLHFKGRPDEGRDAVRQAIIKRLLPEWSRTSLTSFSYPLLLRDPFAVLVETAAVAPDMLRHVLILTYYACVARTVIGLVFILNKTRSYSAGPVCERSHDNVLGDVRMFFMSVVRHSPVFEHTATLVFETFGEARIEQLLYSFTLPFLRRAAILCRSVMPNSFPTPKATDPAECEYMRLLKMLGVPPVSELPRHDTLQNALSGWCAHYGHSHAASQLNSGVMLDYPSVYNLVRLPLVLDNLFSEREKMLTCTKCNTTPQDAAICLLCGAICCVQSDCCADLETSDRGECNLHTRECGGATGLFFLVKRCALLHLYANNGTFGQSPYLDAHGELDVSMRRGRRQYLHYARWEEVRKIWLNQGIPTVIARKLESSLDSGGWETL